ncbi:ABC transporter permease [Sporolactobacillus terrae]|uniref:Glycine betaine transport system permease protein OpuAB n=1 Tax=Sporolactobacillus terrae TaxID=269673 RepID=A0A410DCE8_9BACL|nr:proline/glycine betaine ABC transporter permease [Sporolactobacillus terrae]QAA23810.1 glycine/betaine ABC transporter [Sporolactobacillus terrae]QAA26781.1 glycine/betaine ABC transporter [Sporolactobacillus terrae]UAK15845.1 proline/glycine betaine ABC transporter permease [Sporolactobacillus terrae]BBO00350.1 glycine betaine transport system permease protein OpuAB [Sporolactobacillus terrae]
MNETFLPKIPIGHWADLLIQFITDHFEGFFGYIASGIQSFVDSLVWIFALMTPIVFILICVAIAFWRRGIGVALFTLIGLVLIYDLGYWAHAMQTFALVLTSVVLSILIGFPLGILAGINKTFHRIMTPILDFMQTMPSFVYLIPAIFLFGTGMPPGVVATIVFAMPPTIRMTGLGIRQVPSDLIEASDAFGSTTWQKLFKVQIPIAAPTVMAGVNQSIMLSLSMVVVASLVGAPGLGADVYLAVTSLRTDIGVEAGLAIVIIAIMLDRISQNTRNKKTGES